MVAEQAPLKVARLRRDIRPKRVTAEKRRRRIDRHLMGHCCGKVSEIIGGHTNDDIRRCGGPIGSKRRQKSRSRGLFHGFCPFSRREADYLLPRFLDGVVRLLMPFFVIKLVARGCPGAELRPATSHTLSY